MGGLNLKKSETYIIIGCSRLGASLAVSLSDSGRSVAVIDRDKDSFRKLPPSFGGMMLVGDATDIFVLGDAGVRGADALLAVTNDDNINVLTAFLAKLEFGVEKVIVRLYDPGLNYIVKDAGIDSISPTSLAINRIKDHMGL